MSSDLKDARWELARQNAEAMGLDFFRLGYDHRQRLLSYAQGDLDEMSMREVIKLARAWRDHDE